MWYLYHCIYNTYVRIKFLLETIKSTRFIDNLKKIQINFVVKIEEISEDIFYKFLMGTWILYDIRATIIRSRANLYLQNLSKFCYFSKIQKKSWWNNIQNDRIIFKIQFLIKSEFWFYFPSFVFNDSDLSD